MAEDRRIALTAVVVSGAVGIFAPLLTVLATNHHDIVRFHQELIRSDRTELRAVLDEAVARLNAAQTRLVQVHSSHKPPRVQDVSVLNDSYGRLVIRLGERSPATRAYQAAALDAVVVDAALELSSGKTLPKREMNRLNRDADDFKQLAHDLGRSTLN